MVKQRVSYFYDTDVGHFYYGPGHPMKPHRIKMAHHLILSTGLYRKLDVYRPHHTSQIVRSGVRFKFKYFQQEQNLLMTR